MCDMCTYSQPSPRVGASVILRTCTAQSPPRACQRPRPTNAAPGAAAGRGHAAAPKAAPQPEGCPSCSGAPASTSKAYPGRMRTGALERGQDRGLEQRLAAAAQRRVAPPAATCSSASILAMSAAHVLSCDRVSARDITATSLGRCSRGASRRRNDPAEKARSSIVRSALTLRACVPPRAAATAGCCLGCKVAVRQGEQRMLCRMGGRYLRLGAIEQRELVSTELERPESRPEREVAICHAACKTSTARLCGRSPLTTSAAVVVAGTSASTYMTDPVCVNP